MSGRSLGLLLLALALVLRGAHADETPAVAADSKAEARDDEKDAAAIERTLDVIDLILEHHIDPPTRLEILRRIAGLMFGGDASAAPTDITLLAESCTDRRTSRQFFAQLREKVARHLVAASGQVSVPSNRQIVRRSRGGAAAAPTFSGLLESATRSCVSGDAVLIENSELKAQAQHQANRYVGIGVILDSGDDEGFIRFYRVFSRGPAAYAGIRDGDSIESIDGRSMKGWKDRAIAERIRGPEGTVVTIVVRQKGAAEARTLSVTRGVILRDSVHGWDYVADRHVFRLDPSRPIAYLRISEIGGSTVQELQQVEHQLPEGIKAVVLDLRNNFGGAPHYGVLLADALLDGGTIGRLRMKSRTQEFVADRDCVFRGWPIVVLVNQSTSGSAEWVAAALQDNHRAAIVGRNTHGNAYALGSIPFQSGEVSLQLATGILERPSGKPLVGPWMAPSNELRPNAPSHTRGVIPDFVEMSPPKLVSVDGTVFNQRLSDGANDAGVKKACELLQAELDAQTKTTPARVPKPSTSGD